MNRAVKRIATLTMNPAVDRSCSVDAVVAEHKMRCADVRDEPGGGGINVARAVRKLGEKATAVYAAGGAVGDYLERLLKDAHLDQHHVPIEGQTRLNLTVYEQSSDKQFRFGMPGPQVEEEAWQSCLAYFEGAEADFIVASGSLPRGVPDDFYARLAQIANRRGAKFICDTRGEALKRVVSAGVFLLKPNLREFQVLCGRELNSAQQQQQAALELIRSGGCQSLVLSLGAEGVLFAAQDECVHVSAPDVPIRSKVGAGDSTVGGIVTALARGRPLAEAVRFGVACGSAAVMTPGTELCRREDAERLFREIAP